MIVSLALFMTTLDNLVVTTALPTIQRDLHATVSQLEWTVNAYTLTFAVLLMTGAALGDRFGRKRLFLIGLAIFTLGSAAAALAPSIDGLIAARALQGVGGAIVTPLTLDPALGGGAVGAARSGAGRVGRHLAASASRSARSSAAPSSQGLSWQWIFWLNVPIGLVAVPLACARLRESHGPATRARPARRGARQRRHVRHRVRPRARQLAGLDQPRDRRLARRRRAPDRRLRGLGAARQRADAADAVLPQPGLRGRERRVAADVLRHVRLDLPADPVPADRAGLLGRSARAAHAAVDGHADARRADRRRAVRPHRRPAADRGRARAAGDRARLAGRWCSSRRWPTARSVLPFVLAGVGMALFFAPMANVVLGSVGARAGPGKASGANNAIRELGGVFGVAVLASIFAHQGGYGSAQTVHRRHHPGALGRRRGRRRSAPWPATLIPGKQTAADEATEPAAVVTA